MRESFLEIAWQRPEAVVASVGRGLGIEKRCWREWLEEEQCLYGSWENEGLSLGSGIAMAGSRRV